MKHYHIYSITVAFWFFLGECSVVLRTWWTFHCRIACRYNSFGWVTWESMHNGGRPETCTVLKNIPDEAILRTHSVCDLNYIYGK